MRKLVGLAAVAALAGCATVANVPINAPTSDPQANLSRMPEPDLAEDGLLVGLAFSGGGTRASAFSFGVLQGLANTPVPGRPGGQLIDHVDFITAVSGGSVTAAYFGLKQRHALNDFRERFLLQDAEAPLRTQLSVANLARGLGGGVNEDTRFREWLDANLFEGATFGTLLQKRKPHIWINATDIYNRTPFVFERQMFAAICSDLANYPVSAAVAASAAVPVAFAPIVLETYPERCAGRSQEMIGRTVSDAAAPPMLRALRQGIARYRDGTVKYIKLLDGGLVDNYGLSGFTIAREASLEPYAPMTRQQAARVRRVLFLVVDAGLSPSGDWGRTLEGPTGGKLVSAVTDTMLDASKRASYSAFEQSMTGWRDALIRWRCGAGRVADCRNLRFHIGRISFEDLGTLRAAQLGAVPTSLKLRPEQVDLLIEAGREALRSNRQLREFAGGR